MFEKQLTHDGRTRRIAIQEAGTGGWEVQEEVDRQVVRRARYSDWHRAERAATVRLTLLESEGWAAAY